MADKTKRFETDRLILRKFEISDVGNVFDNYASKDNVTKYLSWKSHKTLEDSKAFLENFIISSYESDDSYKWAIVLKETNEVIGCIDVVRVDRDKSKAELGWVLDDNHWGKGIMPEAGKVVLKYLIDEGFKRIEARHNIENEKSGRVMQKIGMQYEGTLRKYAKNNNGELVDMKIYAYIVE